MFDGFSKSYFRDNSGATSISASFLIGIFILLIGGGVEMGHAYWKNNVLQHATKMGVRSAITIEPVASKLSLIHI